MPGGNQEVPTDQGVQVTKSEIVEALRCAADLCSDRHPSGFRMFGSAVSRASHLTGVPFRAMERAAIDVDVDLIGHAHAESKRTALLEAAQRIEESE